MTLKILHLEDNLLDAELVEANLCEGGISCDVQRVETRAEFVAAVDSGLFEIILADYSLPSFDGLAALEIAHKRKPDTPFIIISGALGEELAIETLKGGATDYILKHRLERLVPSVRRALRESAERKARKRAELERELMLEREQEARKKAEEANRLKDEFLATVSHELRTPLNAIYGWATMLRGGKLDAENAANAVEIIERNAKIQIQLIEDLLDVSRMITGNFRLDIEALVPAQIIRAAADSVRPAADAKSIEISLELDSAVPLIFADAARLQQIIWNLLSNAVKFSPAGGRVTIGLRQNGSDAEIFVRDTGAGISSEFLPHVFERFRQAEQNTTRVHGGLGLGLAIVKNLVEMHGGRVTAESAGLGHGATFTLYLPQTVLASSEVPKIRREIIALESGGEFQKLPARLAGLQILAVEDDADSRELLQILLEQNGAKVILADSAAAAINYLQTSSPDVLISDVGMPIEDGYSLINRIRTNGSKIPAIALTGFAREEDIERAKTAGFNSHISKPIDPDVLVQTIIKIIGNSNA